MGQNKKDRTDYYNQQKNQQVIDLEMAKLNAGWLFQRLLLQGVIVAYDDKEK